jgi:hypothetical protein
VENGNTEYDYFSDPYRHLCSDVSIASDTSIADLLRDWLATGMRGDPTLVRKVPALEFSATNWHVSWSLNAEPNPATLNGQNGERDVRSNTNHFARFPAQNQH